MTIKTSVSDEALSALVAEHVAGFKKSFFLMKRGYYYRPEAKGYTATTEDAGRYSEEEIKLHVAPGEDAVTAHAVPVPPFATSANDVLPLLEKLHAWQVTHEEGRYHNASVHPVSPGNWFYAVGDTFARSVCFALLRAHGCEIVES